MRYLPGAHESPSSPTSLSNFGNNYNITNYNITNNISDSFNRTRNSFGGCLLALVLICGIPAILFFFVFSVLMELLT